MIHMVALVVTCLSLAWVATFVRSWVSIYITRRFGCDDWLVLLAVILFSAECGCTLVLTDPRATARSEISSYMFLSAFELSIMVTMCIKTSLAISLNGFFEHSWQRLIIIAITVIYNIYAIAELFLSLFFCGSPTTMAHKKLLDQCTHWRHMLIWYQVASIFNAVTDWAYILLPAMVVWMSNLSCKVKLSISVITVVGSLSATAAIYRALVATSFTSLRSFDSTNYAAIACVLLEMSLGIIATSMMTSTRLPSLLIRSKTDPENVPEMPGRCPEGDTDIIKLSPIICQQKFGGDTWASTQTHAEIGFPEHDASSLSDPARKANRFSWSRAFGAPGAPGSSVPNITLLIDDISDDDDDDDDEVEVNKEFKELKTVYSNV